MAKLTQDLQTPEGSTLIQLAGPDGKIVGELSKEEEERDYKAFMAAEAACGDAVVESLVTWYQCSWDDLMKPFPWGRSWRNGRWFCEGVKFFFDGERLGSEGDLSGEYRDQGFRRIAWVAGRAIALRGEPCPDVPSEMQRGWLSAMKLTQDGLDARNACDALLDGVPSHVFLSDAYLDAHGYRDKSAARCAYESALGAAAFAMREGDSVLPLSVGDALPPPSGVDKYMWDQGYLSAAGGEAYRRGFPEPNWASDEFCMFLASGYHAAAANAGRKAAADGMPRDPDAPATWRLSFDLAVGTLAYTEPPPVLIP